MIKQLFIVATVVYLGAAGNAAVTRVGNGDDGRDLDGFEKVEAGPIVEARKKAVERLKKLNVSGVKGLGQLLPEVEKSELYVAKKDSQALEAEKASRYESDMTGRVYARTFAEPHAATKFFPISQKLDEEQLIALHIHEGLHRSLAKEVREDEDVVSSLTLAISSPDANYDRVAAVAQKHLPEPVEPMAASSDNGTYSGSSTKITIPEDANANRPSMFRYTYRTFTRTEETEVLSGYRNMHLIESFMYPFGADDRPLGMGLSLSMAGTAEEENELGPLGVSMRQLLWTTRGFDIEWWVEGSLATVTSNELKNSPYGRDVLEGGLKIERSSKYIYFENLLGVTLPSEAKQKVANSEIKYKYGSIVHAKVRAGGQLGSVFLGGFGELHLADNYKVSAPNFEEETGRFNILSGGPEFGFDQDGFTAMVFGRYILSRTKDVTYDHLGNVMGVGVGEGYVGGSLGYRF